MQSVTWLDGTSKGFRPVGRMNGNYDELCKRTEVLSCRNGKEWKDRADVRVGAEGDEEARKSAHACCSICSSKGYIS